MTISLLVCHVLYKTCPRLSEHFLKFICPSCNETLVTVLPVYRSWIGNFPLLIVCCCSWATFLGHMYMSALFAFTVRTTSSEWSMCLSDIEIIEISLVLIFFSLGKLRFCACFKLWSDGFKNKNKNQYYCWILRRNPFAWCIIMIFILFVARFLLEFCDSNLSTSLLTLYDSVWLASVACQCSSPVQLSLQRSFSGGTRC